MTNAILVNTRRMVGNMSDEELREAVKSIPREILEDELSQRSELNEHKLCKMWEIMNYDR